MSDNVLTFTCGRETLPDAPTATYFSIRNPASSAWRSLATTLSEQPTISAGLGMFNDVAGSWTNYSAVFPNGTMLRVVGSFGPKSIYGLGCKMIVVDDHAPYQRIGLRTSQSSKSALMNVGVEGRFNIMTTEEALDAPYLNGIARAQLRQDMPWDFTIIGAGIDTPKVVTRTMLVDGEELSVATVRRKRALRL